MEIFASFSISNFIDFFLFGLIFNVLTTVLIIIVTIREIGLLDSAEYELYKQFVIDRQYFISNKTTKTGRIINNLTMLFPMYKTITGVVYLYYLTRYRGRIGICRGVIKIDKMAIMPLVKYTKATNATNATDTSAHKSPNSHQKDNK